jgi:hypothetical protein
MVVGVIYLVFYVKENSMIKEITCPLSGHKVLLMFAQRETVWKEMKKRFDIDYDTDFTTYGTFFTAEDTEGEDCAVLSFFSDDIEEGNFLWFLSIIAHEVNHLTFYLGRFINNGNETISRDKEEYFNYHFTMLYEATISEIFKDTQIGHKNFNEVVHRGRTKAVSQSNKRKRRKSS